MSLQSWKKEFYPREASDIDDTPDAIEHSITKWKGLLPENLSKHNLEIDDGSIWDSKGQYMVISSGTCALCRLFIEITDCPECPLSKHLGYRCDDGETSPYMVFTLFNNPQPMIDALIACKNEVE